LPRGSRLAGRAGVRAGPVAGSCPDTSRPDSSHRVKAISTTRIVEAVTATNEPPIQVRKSTTNCLLVLRLPESWAIPAKTAAVR
jgi:hypothetical protein